MLGLNRFKSALLTGSKTEYDTKKMQRAAFHCPFVMCKSFCRPAILALPMFVRSRKETRGSKHSHGISFLSILRVRLRSFSE